MTERVELARRLLADIERMRTDLDLLAKTSRHFPPQSKVAMTLKLLIRDITTSHAHALSLVHEIATVDSQRERLANSGGVHRVDATYDSRPQTNAQPIAPSHGYSGVYHPPSPAPRQATPPVQAHAPAPPTERDEPSERFAVPGVSNDPDPEPAPDSPTGDQPRPLASMVSNLPPHVLEELRKQGLR